MKKPLNLLTLAGLFVCLVLSSCRTGIQTKAELVKYISDERHGIAASLNIKGVKISLTHYPSVLMRRIGTIDNSDTEGKSYFVLSFAKEGRELLKQLDFNSYSELIQVLSFRMMSYVFVTVDGLEPVSPINCIFQQTYGMSNSNQLLVVFDRKKINNGKEMNVLVKEFGMGIGDLRFRMNMKNLNYVDSIKL